MHFVRKHELDSCASARFTDGAVHPRSRVTLRTRHPAPSLPRCPKPSARATRRWSPPERSRPIPARRCWRGNLSALERRLDQHRLARKSSSLGWLFGKREQSRRAAQGPLRLRRGRPRQDHADGPVLRDQRRSRASGACISTNSWPTCTSAFTSIRQEIKNGEANERRSDPAHRRGDRRGKLAALLRRIPRHRHRRRHDPRPAVHAAVRARRRGGGDLERAAGRALQGRAQPRAVPAVHRAAGTAHARSCGWRRASISGWRSSPACRSGTCRPTRSRCRARRGLAAAGRRPRRRAAGADGEGPRRAGAAGGDGRGAVFVPRSVRAAAGGRRLSQDRARIPHHHPRPYSGDGLSRSATRPSASSS